MAWLLIIPLVILWVSVSTLKENNTRMHKTLQALRAKVEALTGQVAALTEQVVALKENWRESGAQPASSEAVTEEIESAVEGFEGVAEGFEGVSEGVDSAVHEAVPPAPAPAVPPPVTTSGAHKNVRAVPLSLADRLAELRIAAKNAAQTSAAESTPSPASEPATAFEALRPDQSAAASETQVPSDIPQYLVNICTSTAAPETPIDRNAAALEAQKLADWVARSSPDSKRPAPRSEPTALERLFKAAKDWLFGGNTVLRIGVLLLFLGLAFLLRYASERVSLPVEFRYIGVSAAALTLLALGWRLRLKNPVYGLTLQGAGIALLYLTSFAAMRLHHLLPPSVAFGLLIVFTAAATTLAVLQDALALASAAALGGFAAPILVSTGSGDHVALFSYFALLNTGILLVAWFKAWRVLNLIGFGGTFGIGIAWGIQSYVPELFASTEPFLVLFFFMYVGIGLMFARRKLLEADNAPEDAERYTVLRWSLGNTDYIDGTLMFGPPLIGFGLQYAVVDSFYLGTAFSALALGLFYTLLAYGLRGRERFGLLKEICLALGVMFATLAIPLAFEAQGIAMIWAVEGAGIYWLSLVQRRRLAKAFSLALIVAAAANYLRDMDLGADTLLAGPPLGAALLGGALLFCHYAVLRAPRDALTQADRLGRPVFAVAGLAFLYLLAPLSFQYENTVIAWALAVPVTVFIGSRLESETFFSCAVGILSLGGLLFLGHISRGDDTLLADSPWVAALLGGASLFCYFASRRASGNIHRPYLPALAVAGLAFLYLLAPLCFQYENTVIAWALAGLATFFVSLRLDSRTFLRCAFGIQFLGGLLLLLNITSGDSDTLLAGSPLAALALGGALLFCHGAALRTPQDALNLVDRLFRPVFGVAGLAFLYLLAPLCFLYESTVIAWALAGLATVFAGLGLESRTFLKCAFGIQLLGGLLFLINLQSGEANILASGWTGLLCASLVGLALIASVIIIQSDTRMRRDERLIRRLSLALLAGLVFVNLSLLFVLDWHGIGIGWAGSGLLLLCLGLWQRQGIVLYFGVALEAVAGMVFIYSLVTQLTPFDSWAPAALALAAMAGAWRMHQVKARLSVLDPERIGVLANVLLEWGVGWWVWTLVNQVAVFSGKMGTTGAFESLLHHGNAYLILLTLSLSAALWTSIARRARWRALALTCLLPLPVAVWVLLEYGPGPLALGFPVWTVFFAVHLFSLRRLAEMIPAAARSAVHVAGVWLLVGVLMLAARDVLAYYSPGDESAWPWLGWALAPSLYLWLISGERGRFWPLGAFAREYRLLAALPVMLAMLAWFWMANALSAGNPAPLPYLPLLNPLELGLLLVLLTCWRWSRARLPQIGFESSSVNRLVAIAAGVSLLAFLTLAVCRVAYSWANVPFLASAMKASMEVQAGWSLVWALFALALMIGGHRHIVRSVWMAGAALITVVVAKLFFVELGGQGSLARIISFIGVGVLLLIVGYFSPLPPKVETARREDA